MQLKFTSKFSIFLFLIYLLIFLQHASPVKANSLSPKTKTINYLSVEQLLHHYTESRIIADFEKIKKLLNIHNLRLAIDPESFSLSSKDDREKLTHFLESCKKYKFNVDFILFESRTNYQNTSSDIEWLTGFLEYLQPFDQVMVIGLSTIDWAKENSFEWFKSIYASLINFKTKRTYVYGLSFQSLKELSTYINLDMHQPDLYLFYVNLPEHILHQTIIKLHNMYPELSVQITRFTSPDPEDEQDQAWFHRFNYYFSKKYGFLPAVATLYDINIKGWQIHGLERSDQTIRPDFLYSQIYYQINRIDLDEIKLTNVLYRYAPPLSKYVLPKKPKSFVKAFLNTYYKVDPIGHVLNYIETKKSRLFYNYVKFETEENLLSSHFAFPEKIEILDEYQHPNHTEYRVRVNFHSALGDYGYLQNISVKNTKEGLKITHLSKAELDFHSFKINTHQASAIPIKQHPVKGLDIISHASISKDPYSNIEYKIESGHQSILVWFRATNRTDQMIDLKPIELIEESTGRVYIPEPILFDYYKNINPGDSVAGMIRIPQLRQSLYTLNLDYIKSKNILEADNNLLNRFEVKIGKDNENRLIIEAFNNHYERAILPTIFYMIDTPEGIISSAQTLPAPLLPMEKTYIEIPKSRLLQVNDARAFGLVYPVVNYHLNLDEAFRYKVMDLLIQALGKYVYISQRFKDQISSRSLKQISQEIFYLYIRLKNYPDAEEYLDYIIKKAPDATSTFYQNAFLDLYDYYIKLKDLDSSLRVTKKGLNAFPEHYRMLENLGYIYNLSGKKQLALEAYLQAYQSAKSNKGRILEALYYLSRDLKKNDDALSYLKQLIAINPQGKFYKELGYIYKQNKQYSKAIEAYLSYYKLTGKVLIYSEIAGLYMELKQTSSAIAAFEKLLPYCRDRSCGKHFSTVAYLYKERKQYNQAISAYQKYGRFTGDYQYHNILGDLLIKNKRNFEAIRAFEAFIRQCNKNCVPIFKNLGYLYKTVKNNNQAINYYEKYLRYKPDAFKVLYELAYLYQSNNRKLQAVRALEKLIRSNAPLKLKEKLQAQSDLAYLYKEVGRPQNAIAMYKSILQKGKLSYRQEESLLYSYLESGNTDAALRFIERRNFSARVDPTVHYTIGKILRSANRCGRAIPWFLRAISLSPRPKIEYYKLTGTCYERIGDVDKAIAFLERADELSGN